MTASIFLTMRFGKEVVPNGLEADIAKQEFVFDNSGGQRLEELSWNRSHP